MIRIAITETGAVPGVLKRELNRLLKEAWAAIGLYWHKNFRPKHFTRAGAREYGYDKRQGEDGAVGENPGDFGGMHGMWRAQRRLGPRGFFSTYTGRKLQKWNHTNPLVWTGISKEQSEQRNIQATRNGVKVVMNTPRLNFRKGKLGMGKTMREEMTAVSAAEAEVLAQVYDTNLTRGISDIKEVRRWEAAF